MPELPEVETVMRGVEPALLGRRIERAKAFRADLRWPLPRQFAERLTGRRVLGLSRRSKYILLALDDGWTWLAHLGMTGRFSVEAMEQLSGNANREAGSLKALGPHDHLVLETAHHRLTYNDVRRFGSMDLTPTAEVERHKLIAGLGPEPMSNGFNSAYLAKRLEGRTTNLKAALMDQRVVAGLGNIYVCEALWRARLNPTRAVATLDRSEIAALVKAVKKVLGEAIASGGSSLRDYRQADGELGYFQHSFSVYGREGEVCRRRGCGGVVARTQQAGRSSFFCADCQC